MTFAATPQLLRTHRWLIAAAVAALAVAGILGWSRPAAILPAYRLAVFVCLAPAIGSMFFALVHRTTGGHWGDALQPFLAAGCQLAPWLWLLVFPLWFFAAPATEAWPHYESRAMLALRAAGYAAVLFGLAASLLSRRTVSAPWVGPVGLIVLVFTLHFVADDWLASLDPGWHSTAFPLVWMLGQAVAGFGCAVLAALLCGFSPGASVVPRSLGLDWGNLLLTAALLWCYVTFAQFLIIWGGNLPSEISWFTRRLNGGWAAVPGVLALLHFVLPLGILLSRRLKRSTAALGAAAGILIFAQALFLAWMILPALSASQGVGSILAFTAVAGAAALFFHQYLNAATQRLNRP